MTLDTPFEDVEIPGGEGQALYGAFLLHLEDADIHIPSTDFMMFKTGRDVVNFIMNCKTKPNKCKKENEE